MKARGLAVFAALTAPHAALADPPSHLRCKVSGHAGCSDICVGAGVNDHSIRMTINTKARTVDINGITGAVNGEAPFEASGSRTISWRWGLIGMSYMRFNRTPNGELYITLSDRKA